MDRLGLAIGGEYRAYSFLKLEAGYETHFRNLGDSEWKFRHRYNFGATASFQNQWLKIVLRERFQQTFDRGDSKARLRSRLKLAYAPEKESFPPTSQLKFIKVWMTLLFGEQIVCVIGLE